MKRDTRAEEKIISTLLDHTGEKLYMSQVAQEAGTAVTTTHQVLERKAEESFVKKEKLGNLSLYSVDPQDALVRQMKVKKTIELFRLLINKLKDSCQKIILFGSAAQGKDAVSSDLDLFILSNEKGEVQRIIKKSKIGRKIKPVIKNFLEWMAMKEENKFFYEEIKKGIVLWEGKNE